MCPQPFHHVRYISGFEEVEIINDKILILHIPMCEKIWTYTFGKWKMVGL